MNSEGSDERTSHHERPTVTDRSCGGSSRLGPPPMRRGLWTSRRDAKALLVLKLASVAVAFGMALGFGWITHELVEAPGKQLARTCALGPAAMGPITAAGGPDGLSAAPTAMRPYTRLPALTDLWLTDLRAHAAAAGDEALTHHALLVLRGSIQRNIEQLAGIEGLCAQHMTDKQIVPAPRSWFLGGEKV